MNILFFAGLLMVTGTLGAPPPWLLTIPLQAHGNSRYALRLAKKSFDAAQADCKSLRGYLAEMDTDAEWTHVYNERKRIHPKDPFWLGAKGDGIYGGWQWVKSKKFIKSCPKGVSNWHPGHPAFTGLFCLVSAATKYTETSNWADTACTRSYFYICEFS